MRLIVEGTTQPVELRLFNRTPAVVAVEPYAHQAVWTSGGTINMVERSVRGLRRGAFTIDYALAGASVPLAARAGP